MYADAVVASTQTSRVVLEVPSRNSIACHGAAQQYLPLLLCVVVISGQVAGVGSLAYVVVLLLLLHAFAYTNRRSVIPPCEVKSEQEIGESRLLGEGSLFFSSALE